MRSKVDLRDSQVLEAVARLEIRRVGVIFGLRDEGGVRVEDFGGPAQVGEERQGSQAGSVRPLAWIERQQAF